MTRPVLGAVIVAKYGGTCTRSGQGYAAGARIALDDFGNYLEGQPDPGGKIVWGGGEGYGATLRQIGDVVSHEAWNPQEKRKVPGQAVVITWSKSRYCREDGMSFGVGKERGSIYSARARPATPEEAAPLLARREAARLAQERRADLTGGPYPGACGGPRHAGGQPSTPARPPPTCERGLRPVWRGDGTGARRGWAACVGAAEQWGRWGFLGRQQCGNWWGGGYWSPRAADRRASCLDAAALACAGGRPR